MGFGDRPSITQHALRHMPVCGNVPVDMMLCLHHCSPVVPRQRRVLPVQPVTLHALGITRPAAVLKKTLPPAHSSLCGQIRRVGNGSCRPRHRFCLLKALCCVCFSSFIESLQLFTRRGLDGGFTPRTFVTEPPARESSGM